MTFARGARLGPYEIVEAIGSGGMGAVYRARDTRLDRTVAIKVLHADVAMQPALRQRFEREARAVSSLNHPHVCALFDIGMHEGTEFLVMELLEGETLGERLKRGALSSDEALRVAIQISDALDRAHRQGVVHRDLKPGNVMLTKAGAKLLDFGLAKVGGVLVGGEHGRSRAAELTAEGSLIGTLQYMAPEQLHGRDADSRSDLFAFGALLYEMVTGRCAFQGDSSASVIAAILNDDPRPIRELKPLTPPALERAVKRCLTKDPDDRWQSARDLMHELRWIAESGATAGDEAAAPRRSASRARAAWIVAAAAAAAAFAATFARWPDRAAPQARVARLALTLPFDSPFEYFASAAVSPDGNRVAFIGFTSDGKQSLWVRDLAEDAPRLLQDTDGARRHFWSPNGRSLAFFADGKLKRMEAAGGPAQVLCDAPEPYGGSWSADGTILFGNGAGGTIARVPDTGGKPVAATRLEAKEEAHRWPTFLPDGRHFVFLGDASKSEDHHFKLGSLDSLESRELMRGISNVQWIAPGYLLYVRSGSLQAQRFDAKAMELEGNPITIADSIVQVAENHLFEFSGSNNGVITYRRADPRSQLAWIDRATGKPRPVGRPERYGFVSASPDGRFAAFEQDDAEGRPASVWTLDFERGVATRVTPVHMGGGQPVWSPVDDRIAFTAFQGDGADLYVARAFQASEPLLVLASPRAKWASSWSSDGRSLFFDSTSVTTRDDVFVVPIDEPTAVRSVLATEAPEHGARISPDGRWLAYETDESGRTDVALQSFPGGRRIQVSTRGGSRPRWRRDGSELYYATPSGHVMAVGIQGGAELEIAAPKDLFAVVGGEFWDVSADGQQFLVSTPVENVVGAPLRIVLDWTAAIDKR